MRSVSLKLSPVRPGFLNRLLAIVLCLPATIGSAAELVSHDIIDQFGFGQPLKAFTLKAPPGWSVNGSVQWAGRPDCPFDQMKWHFMATAPDGKQWVELIPGGAWGWNSNFDYYPAMAQQGMMGCAALKVLDVQSFVRQYVPMIRPGATIESTRMRPDIVQKLQAAAAAGGGQVQPGQRQRIEAMEVRVNYPANGSTVHELMIPSVIFIDQPGPDPQGGMTGYLTLAITMGTLITATVDGPADENVMNLIGDTVDADPAYLQRWQQNLQQKTQLMIEAMKRRQAAQQATLAAMRARNASSSSSWKVDTTGSEILDIQKKGYDATTAMKDAGQANTVNMIHERQPWQTTTGSTIYMPQEYQAVYQLPNQVYAGTNDPFFNPLQTFGQFGEQLQPLSGQ